MYYSNKSYTFFISLVFFLATIRSTQESTEKKPITSGYTAEEKMNSFQEKFLKLIVFTGNNVGDKLQTVIGIPVLYYGFYSLFAKWKQMIAGSGLGETQKKILTFGDPEFKGHILNYIVPGIGLIMMPKVDSVKSFKFFFRVSNFAKKVIAEKSAVNQAA